MKYLFVQRDCMMIVFIVFIASYTAKEEIDYKLYAQHLPFKLKIFKLQPLQNILNIFSFFFFSAGNIKLLNIVI